MPESDIASLFSGISFTADRAIVHEGDTYRTASGDEALLDAVHRLFGTQTLSVEELDRRISEASDEDLCLCEVCEDTLVHLSSRSSDADLRRVAEIACASLSQNIVPACEELQLSAQDVPAAHRTARTQIITTTERPV